MPILLMQCFPHRDAAQLEARKLFLDDGDCRKFFTSNELAVKFTTNSRPALEHRSKVSIKKWVQKEDTGTYKASTVPCKVGMSTDRALLHLVKNQHTPGVEVSPADLAIFRFPTFNARGLFHGNFPSTPQTVATSSWNLNIASGARDSCFDVPPPLPLPPKFFPLQGCRHFLLVSPRPRIWQPFF